MVGLPIVMLAAAPRLAAAEPATTTWTSYLYQGPGSRYAVVGEVPQATSLDVTGCDGDWCKVVLDRRVGYLRAEIVSKADAAHPPAGILPQPAAGLSPLPPPGPCIEANQTGGNGGNAMTIFCRK